MKREFEIARFVQIGFFVTGAVFLLIVYLGAGGLLGAVISLAATIPFVAYIIHKKCRNCGVSYYFDAELADWNMTGANVLKPVQVKCPKCGVDR